MGLLDLRWDLLQNIQNCRGEKFFAPTDRRENIEPTHRTIGLDVGIESFYTDSQGSKADNPQFDRVGEAKLKQSQKRVSRKVKGSNHRAKARALLGKAHLKIRPMISPRDPIPSRSISQGKLGRSPRHNLIYDGRAGWGL